MLSILHECYFHVTFMKRKYIAMIMMIRRMTLILCCDVQVCREKVIKLFTSLCVFFLFNNAQMYTVINVSPPVRPLAVGEDLQLLGKSG